MKKVILFLSFFLFTMTACDKDCMSTENPVCNESVPNPNFITCHAYFESWFYDSSTSTCTKEGYSGCGESGFQTKEECETCKCNN
ncbi:MAG: BPTI/Kunitz-type proteinase inhibitor domain-containing protein [Saprospiraceae bacterium]